MHTAVEGDVFLRGIVCCGQRHTVLQPLSYCPAAMAYGAVDVPEYITGVNKA